LHDTVSLYLVDEFQTDLPQTSTMSVAIAEKVFEVAGQGHSKVKKISLHDAISPYLVEGLE